MTSRRLGVGVLGAAGLALYLWPALAAPVVLWTDSLRDLEWARAGVGILTPAPIPAIPHPAKPFFILFLEAVMAVAPSASPERAIVVAQSLLVWAAIGAAAVAVGRRFTFTRGATLYVVLLLLLRLRDASSAVMSEALSAAIFLVLAASMLDPPEGYGATALLGLGAGTLFLVRPNEGAAAAVLAVLSWALRRRWRPPLIFTAVFFGLVLPVWIATMPPHDPWRGMSPAFTAARAEYGWTPDVGLPLPSDPVDSRRELLWRTFHGVFGTEYYDARWSSAYRRMTELSRILTPWMIMAAAAVLLAAPKDRKTPARVLGLTLLVILIAQSFVLGALPRFALPMLPGVLLFAVAAAPKEAGFGARRLALAAGLFAAVGVFLEVQPDVLDWEWGKIESTGVRLVQVIPRGALPKTVPATLHLRIAAPVIPTGAGVSVRGPDGRLLYETTPSSEHRRPFISVPLDPAILDRNRSGPVVLTVEATGVYGPAQFLLFPVVPPPWDTAARREKSADVSPDSGITEGGLDWWAHPGAP